MVAKSPVVPQRPSRLRDRWDGDSVYAHAVLVCECEMRIAAERRQKSFWMRTCITYCLAINEALLID